MKFYYSIAIVLLFFANSLVARPANMVRVKAIGSSPRGQYVAFEEYGFKNGKQLPFSKIRVMNVWKGKYVENPVQVIGTKRSEELNSIRKKAKILAHKKLEKFNISM